MAQIFPLLGEVLGLAKCGAGEEAPDKLAWPLRAAQTVASALATSGTLTHILLSPTDTCPKVQECSLIFSDVQ